MKQNRKPFILRYAKRQLEMCRPVSDQRDLSEEEKKLGAEWERQKRNQNEELLVQAEIPNTPPRQPKGRRVGPESSVALTLKTEAQTSIVKSARQRQASKNVHTELLHRHTKNSESASNHII